MSKFEVDESQWGTLEDKVFVLTGGANGIGLSIVKYLHEAKTKVVFGDINTKAAESLLESLGSPSNITFVKVDVTSYQENLALFKTALQKYERVDHAIACAGILEQTRWFDAELNIDNVEKEPTTAVLEVNLKGVAYFTRIAHAYLKQGMISGDNKSITLMSSAAGFRQSPGLPIYNASKHGVQGLMRSLRQTIWPRDGVRINNICPGITDTDMTTSIIDVFKDSGQAFNTPAQVAKFPLAIAAAKGVSGKAVYVEGGRGWEIEEGLDRTMPDWLGEQPTQRLLEGMKSVAQGDPWKIK